MAHSTSEHLMMARSFAYSSYCCMFLSWGLMDLRGDPQIGFAYCYQKETILKREREREMKCAITEGA